MKLLTKEIESQFEKFPLYSQEEKGNDAKVICKFFAPVGGFTWYVTEGEKQGDDYTLNELNAVRLPFGLRIERDIYFKSCKLSDV